jgi:hypothetical protein
LGHTSFGEEGSRPIAAEKSAQLPAPLSRHPKNLYSSDMANRKSIVLSLVLTFFFGPFGMLYSTVPGALIMLALYVALGILTLGWALVVLHPIAVIWGAIAADRANR